MINMFDTRYLKIRAKCHVSLQKISISIPKCRACISPSMISWCCGLYYSCPLKGAFGYEISKHGFKILWGSNVLCAWELVRKWNNKFCTIFFLLRIFTLYNVRILKSNITSACFMHAPTMNAPKVRFHEGSSSYTPNYLLGPTTGPIVSCYATTNNIKVDGS